MRRNEKLWMSEYQKKDALWVHSGNPKQPHAELASGNHSNGFFNSRLVIADEALLSDAAHDLMEQFIWQIGDVCISRVQGVVGPQTGAAKLAELISKHVVALKREKFVWASPAKYEKDGVKSMVFSDEDQKLLLGQSVLLCEDVVTTGTSSHLAGKAVEAAGGKVYPVILTLVNRSGLVVVGGKRIIALINQHMPIWTPDECPLCQEGSEAVRPKDNWERLNAVC